MGLRQNTFGSEMGYYLKYHQDVKRIDLPEIDNKNRQRIKKAIEERLTTKP